MRFVALLRGINVGGHNKLPMAELRALCADLGFTDIKTYIQSGNVAFEADADPADTLRAGIVERFGLTVPVVVRTREQLREAQANNPFDVDDKRLHLGFMDRVADGSQLDPNRSPGDVFQVIGDVIYVRYGGPSHKSKLTLKWFEKQLGCTATARNWRTVGRLLTL
jgi:uncharacterized protein (DUF1697 family)